MFLVHRDQTSIINFFRLRIIFHLYDKNNDQILSSEELKTLITDLANGQTHINRLLTSMGVAANTSVTMRQYIEAVNSGAFQKLFLHTRDIFDAHTNCNANKGRVVLHPRAVMSSIPRPTELVRPPTSRMIDGAALNTNLIIDPEMYSAVDWRGEDVAPLHSNEYIISHKIVLNTQLLLHHHLFRNETGVRDPQMHDIDDRNWLRKGLVLNFLFNTSDKQIQLQIFDIIINDCLRIVSNQPTMVCPAHPCKVFGDIHGQFRDLLLLFKEFGFPSHKGGDVESVSYVFDGDFVDRGKHQIEVS
jgi:hypothetical protein